MRCAYSTNDTAITISFAIDGRNIPYPVFHSAGYFELHDQIGDVDCFMEQHVEINMGRG